MVAQILRTHEQASQNDHDQVDFDQAGFHYDHRRFLLRSKEMKDLVPRSMVKSSRHPGMLGYSLAYARVSGQPSHPGGLVYQFRLMYLRFGPTNYCLAHKHSATAPRGNDKVQMTDLIGVIRYYNITIVVITAFDRLSRSVDQLNILRVWCPYLRIVVVDPSGPNRNYSVLDDIVLEGITLAQNEGALINARINAANFVQLHWQDNFGDRQELVELLARNEWGNF